MKRLSSVSILAFVLTGLSGCHEVAPVTTHYGHGQHRCYYHNAVTHASYNGVSSDKDKAMKIAKKACVDALHSGLNYCHFADCVFK